MKASGPSAAPSPSIDFVASVVLMRINTAPGQWVRSASTNCTSPSLHAGVSKKTRPGDGLPAGAISERSGPAVVALT